MVCLSILSCALPNSFNADRKSVKFAETSAKAKLTSANFSAASRCSRIETAKSMLRAWPFNFETPTMSSSTVIDPSPDSSMSRNRVLTSDASNSIDASQVLTPSLLMTSLNSSKSRQPSPVVSAFSNKFLILCSCVFMAICFCLTMMRSSVAATLNVSCMNTPLMTPTTAKPMVNLWIKAGMRYASETFSTSSLQTGGQFASVISNNESKDLEKVPKYS
mmetsp:Transcript_56219/g.126481  ORF Transcript_56219/g.126481 Transcript_56219/m.126481 type:complete len:219 (+) Transcript_56219:538-1194(+)